VNLYSDGCLILLAIIYVSCVIWPPVRAYLVMRSKLVYSVYRRQAGRRDLALFRSDGPSAAAPTPPRVCMGGGWSAGALTDGRGAN